MTTYLTYITWLILSSLAFISFCAYVLKPFADWIENKMRKRAYEKQYKRMTNKIYHKIINE